MRGRRFRRICATLVAVIGLIVIVALATGEVALVTTHGVSMEPRFHTGDLAIVVPASEYHVGDIVGYHSPLLHIVVLHRIVAEHAGLFTFKGDNNNFLDPVKVPSSAIEGRLWARVPHAGIVLGWVRSPLGLGILAFVLFSLRRGRGHAPSPHAPAPRRCRRGRGACRLRHRVSSGSGSGVSGSGPKHAAPKAPPVRRWPVVIPLVLACGFGLLATEAWALPTTRPSERPVAYVQHVTFSYSARAPRDTTYPTGSVTTGAPVFVHLVKTLTLTVLYQFDRRAAWIVVARRPPSRAPSAQPSPSRGRGGGAVGWPRVAPVAFSGPTAKVHVAVALARITALESAFKSETGIPLAATNIVVTPTVHVHGSVGGAKVTDTYAPLLTMQMNGQELNLVSSGPYGAAPTFPELTPKQPGSAGRPDRVPAGMAVLGRSLAIGVARRLWLGAVGSVDRGGVHRVGVAAAPSAHGRTDPHPGHPRSRSRGGVLQPGGERPARGGGGGVQRPGPTGRALRLRDPRARARRRARVLRRVRGHRLPLWRRADAGATSVAHRRSRPARGSDVPRGADAIGAPDTATSGPGLVGEDDDAGVHAELLPSVVGLEGGEVGVEGLRPSWRRPARSVHGPKWSCCEHERPFALVTCRPRGAGLRAGSTTEAMSNPAWRR